MSFARKRHVLLFLLLASCADTVYLRDVQDSFRTEHAALRFDLPTQEDVRPLQFHPPHPPMNGTVQLAERFLDQGGQGTLNTDYVSALLACCYLAQWRIDDAYEVGHDLLEPPVSAPELERAVIDQIGWAISACRALQGRLAIEEMLRTEAGLVDFIEVYGDFVGYILPRNKHARDYGGVLEGYVLQLQRDLFPARPWGPRKLERRKRKITDMRRLLSEQVYNDAATLLKRLRARTREHPHETDAFFAATLSGLYITLALLSEDLVPRMKMEPAQKQWLREQALSTYEAARATADAYLDRRAMPELETGELPKPYATPEECYRRLYARLFVAEREVQGWITIR